MTPVKCARHELQLGELADSPRYTRALQESLVCWRCRVLSVLAHAKYRIDCLRGREPWWKVGQNGR